ncbi:MAG TPA: cyclin-dependent kinase inhibitor 3 family protein [Candidatus Limnocylindria bacterium]|nr:cyclin-dependent kinase inhibitor 3 family protein [Candidatus Limnocylindria bacterium]
MTNPDSRPLIDCVEARPGAYIGLTPCPGGDRFPSGRQPWQRDLGADFDVMAAWGAAAVVTLLQASELSRPSLAEMRFHAERRGMEWHHLPIRDQAVPTRDFEASWPAVADRLHALLEQRRNVLLHCLGGLGRSGMIAARLLVEIGEEPRAAIQRVRHSRPGAIETAAQETYVLACRRREPPAPA